MHIFVNRNPQTPYTAKCTNKFWHIYTKYGVIQEVQVTCCTVWINLTYIMLNNNNENPSRDGNEIICTLRLHVYEISEQANIYGEVATEMALERKSKCTEGTLLGTVYWGTCTALCILAVKCAYCEQLPWTSQICTLFCILYFRKKFYNIRKYKHTINVKKQVSVGENPWKLSYKCKLTKWSKIDSFWLFPRFFFYNQILPFDLFMTHDNLSKRIWHHNYWTKPITGFLVFTGRFWDIKIVPFSLVYIYFFPHVNIENISTIFLD